MITGLVLAIAATATPIPSDVAGLFRVKYYNDSDCLLARTPDDDDDNVSLYWGTQHRFGCTIWDQIDNSTTYVMVEGDCNKGIITTSSLYTDSKCSTLMPYPVENSRQDFNMSGGGSCVPMTPYASLNGSKWDKVEPTSYALVTNCNSGSASSGGSSKWKWWEVVLIVAGVLAVAAFMYDRKKSSHGGSGVRLAQETDANLRVRSPHLIF